MKKKLPSCNVSNKSSRYVDTEKIGEPSLIDFLMRFKNENSLIKRETGVAYTLQNSTFISFKPSTNDKFYRYIL